MSKDITVFMEIYRTEDYDKFKTHELQPSGRRGGDLELQDSLRVTNGNSYCPILVSKNTMQIIDGHRRWYQCRLLSLPVYYMFVDIKEEAQLMASMNNTSKNWSTNKFIEHYSFTRPSYEQLASFLSLEGANTQLLTLFTEFGYQSLKKGVDISSINYVKLEAIRDGVMFVHGLFQLSKTACMRSIKKLSKKHDDFSIDTLINHLKRDRLNGVFENIYFINNQDKLTDILEKSYNKLK